MPDHLNSFSLDFLTPDSFTKIVKKAIGKGTRVPAVHGNYINYHLGDIMLIIRTAFDEEKGLDYITGFDSHAKGCCVWSCETVMDLTKDFEDKSVKTIAVKNGDKVIPLPLINGDIFEEYTPGGTFKAQVAAYPETLSFSEAKEGETLSVTAQEGYNVSVTAKALGFRRAETTYMGGTMTRFLIALAETEMGQLEVVFPDKLVAEGEEDLLVPGSILKFTGEFAANPAILEMEQGYQKPGEEEA